MDAMLADGSHVQKVLDRRTQRQRISVGKYSMRRIVKPRAIYSSRSKTHLVGSSAGNHD